MKRWLPIAVAALLTLGGLTLFAAPAMARDYHPRPVHRLARGYHRTWLRNAAKHEAHVRHVVHVRARWHAEHRR